MSIDQLLCDGPQNELYKPNSAYGLAEIQRRISIASSVENEVRRNARRVKRLRQSIFKRAVEGKLVDQDPATSLPANYLSESRLNGRRGR